MGPSSRLYISLSSQSPNATSFNNSASLKSVLPTYELLANKSAYVEYALISQVIVFYPILIVLGSIANAFALRVLLETDVERYR